MAQAFRPPATQRLYDVCVVGSQLGGAVAGALLARRGFRVLHVDHDGTGAHYEDAGWLLPHAPAIIPSPRLFPAAELALGELGFATDLGRALETSSPALQVLLPRHRLDLHAEPAARLAELRREWPRDADPLEGAIQGLFRQFDAASPFLRAMPPLPPDGFGERRAVSQALKFAASAPGGDVDLEADPFLAVRDHPLALALAEVTRFMGHLDGPIPPLARARLLGAALRGTHRLSGGYEGLRDLVRRRIAESRGELLGADGTPAIVERLELDGKQIAGVRLEGSSNAWIARVYIAATDAPAVRRILPEEVRGKVEALDEIRATHQLLSANYVVRATALPPGLGETAIAPGPEGAALLVQVLPARRDLKKGGAGELAPDERVLAVAGWMPSTAREEGEAGISRRTAAFRAAVADALPFLDRHLVLESIPILAAPAERRGSRFLPHPLYDVDVKQTLGLTGLPFRSLKNLIFAGREVVPGLGLEGEFHAGVQAAAAAQELLGSRKFLK